MRERQALRDGRTCRESALCSRSLRPAGTAPLDPGRQAEGTGARGPGCHPASLHSSAVTQPSAPRTTPGRPAQLCAPAAPSTSSYVGGGGWLWRRGCKPGPRLCRVATTCSPCFRGRDPRRPCESEPPASRGSCLRFRQSYRVCAACVCVRRACACVPCLETCTQALDSCHCVPVCSVTAGRDPSLVCSGSRELLAGCPQALGHCCVHCAGSTGAPLLPPAPLLPGELPAGPPVCNQSPGRNNPDASKKSAV